MRSDFSFKSTTLRKFYSLQIFFEILLYQGRVRIIVDTNELLLVEI